MGRTPCRCAWQGDGALVLNESCHACAADPQQPGKGPVLDHHCQCSVLILTSFCSHRAVALCARLGEADGSETKAWVACTPPPMQFYKHGCWQRVVIDNYLPCVEGEDHLAYAYRCKDNLPAMMFTPLSLA